MPLFNVEPAVGEPARFGFMPEEAPVLLDTAMRTGGDYGVTVNVTNISQERRIPQQRSHVLGRPGR